MPKWYSFSNNNLISDTLVGTIAYTIQVTGTLLTNWIVEFLSDYFLYHSFVGLEETYQSLALEVKTRTCSKKQHHAVAKLCVPWTVGFDRYHHFTWVEAIPISSMRKWFSCFRYSDIENEVMQLNVPVAKPSGYNTTENPVTIKLNLDPNCRYEIT